MNYLSLLFSPKGRINTKQLKIGFAILFLPFMAVELTAWIAAMLLGGSEKKLLISYLPIPVIAFLLITICVSAISIFIKRIHDHNKSGIWASVVFGPLPVALFWGPQWLSANRYFIRPEPGAFLLIWALMMSWFAISAYLLFTRSDEGPNQYGPAPESAQ